VSGDHRSVTDDQATYTSLSFPKGERARNAATARPAATIDAVADAAFIFTHLAGGERRRTHIPRQSMSKRLEIVQLAAPSATIARMNYVSRDRLAR